MSNVLILGATSDISVALAHELARAGDTLILAGRNMEGLSAISQDLKIRYESEAYPARFDATDFQSHKRFYKELPVSPDVVIAVFGYLGDQQLAEKDWEESRRIVESNFSGAVSILNIVANDLEKRKNGMIVGISSVAGDRGKYSNYLYGSAKAGFTAYLSGLRNRMFHSNVHVMTVKPGFVATRMTAGMKLPGPLTARPTQVARQILKAMKSKRNTLYTLGRWRLLMLVINSIPEFLFKRLKL